jgi:acyl carrier protein
MMPARILVRDSLPLTANGKIDRKALVALAGETIATDAAGAPQAPESDSERLLSAIVRAEIGGPNGVDAAVDVTANFFEIGANSVQLVKIHAAVSRQLEIPLAVTDFFTYPTIRELAAHIDAITGKGADVRARTARDDVIDRRAQRKRAVAERPKRGA